MSLIRVQSPAAPADRATGHREPPPGADPGKAVRTRDARSPDPGALRTPGGIRTRKYTLLKRARLPVAARAYGAAVRCRPGHPALRERGRKPCAAAKLAILASNQETPRPERGGSAGFPQMAIEYGRRESNAQAATFEEARSARLPSLPRAPPGS